MRSMMIALLYGCSAWALAAPPIGLVQVRQAGALIHYGALRVAFELPDAAAPADLRLQLPSNGAAPRVLVSGQMHRLPLWQSFSWRKNGMQLRITALPWADSAPALLLDFGKSDYRIVIAGAADAHDIEQLQRYPGADLALLLRDGRRQIVVPAQGRQIDSPYRLRKMRRSD